MLNSPESIHYFPSGVKQIIDDNFQPGEDTSLDAMPVDGENTRRSLPVGVIAADELIIGLRFAVKKHLQNLLEMERMPRGNLPIWYIITKRLIDVLGGIIGLIILSPLMLTIAALIKFDSEGPVFYCQKRVGKNGKAFKMFKFRTMVADAEKKTGPVWARENDPRVTAVGRILRNSKLDELPQLFNLINGKMSLVGPRPERPYFVGQFREIVPSYEHRLTMIPGITGLAQLRNGYDREAEDVIRKLKYDLTYMQQRGLWTDLKLIFETIAAVVTKKTHD